MREIFKTHTKEGYCKSAWLNRKRTKRVPGVEASTRWPSEVLPRKTVRHHRRSRLAPSENLFQEHKKPLGGPKAYLILHFPQQQLDASCLGNIKGNMEEIGFSFVYKGLFLEAFYFWFISACLLVELHQQCRYSSVEFFWHSHDRTLAVLLEPILRCDSVIKFPSCSNAPPPIAGGLYQCLENSLFRLQFFLHWGLGKLLDYCSHQSYPA